MSNDPCTLGDGRVLREAKSGLALLISVENEEIWVPKSILHDESDIDETSEVGDEGDVVVPEWWAEQEGWA